MHCIQIIRDKIVFLIYSTCNQYRVLILGNFPFVKLGKVENEQKNPMKFLLHVLYITYKHARLQNFKLMALFFRCPMCWHSQLSHISASLLPFQPLRSQEAMPFKLKGTQCWRREHEKIIFSRFPWRLFHICG